jgi:hypothetical protein
MTPVRLLLRVPVLKRVNGHPFSRNRRFNRHRADCRAFAILIEPLLRRVRGELPLVWILLLVHAFYSTTY